MIVGNKLQCNLEKIIEILSQTTTVSDFPNFLGDVHENSLKIDYFFYWILGNGNSNRSQNHKKTLHSLPFPLR